MAKIERATDQLECVTELLLGFMFTKPKPYSSRVEVDDDGRNIEFWVDVLAHPPLIWSARIGEIVHDLRSALDHVMWQLVIRDGGTPHDRTQFPIMDSPDAFKREQLITVRGKRERIGSLVGLDRKSITLLEAIQPYNLIEDHGGPFWALREFSNFDKHRELHLTGAVLHRAVWDIPAVSLGTSPPELVSSHAGPLEDSTMTHHFRLVDGVVSKDVKVKREPTFVIVFGQGSPIPGLAVVKGLNDVRKRVIWLVREVEIKRFQTTPSFSPQA